MPAEELEFPETLGNGWLPLKGGVDARMTLAGTDPREHQFEPVIVPGNGPVVLQVELRNRSAIARAIRGACLREREGTLALHAGGADTRVGYQQRSPGGAAQTPRTTP